MKKNLVVLHEYGEPGHFRGLEYLMATQYPQGEIRYREFSLFAGFRKGLQTRRVDPFKKQLDNFRFLTELYFSRDRTVILGMAPFDFRLVFLRRFLRDHKVFYFTSWPYWDYTRYPKRLFARHPRVISAWKIFLENEIAGVIAVTHRALTGLRNAYQIQAPCQVVYHAFDSSIFYPGSYQQEGYKGPLKCLFVGRMVREKGIFELLELIHRLPEDRFEFTFVGRGPLSETVARAAASKRNVTYPGSIPNPRKLADVYRNSHVLLLPSRKNSRWEETFGMVLIEGLACGNIFMATNHVGPRELREICQVGYLWEENEFVEKAAHMLAQLYTDRERLYQLQRQAVVASRHFNLANIAARWDKILAASLACPGSPTLLGGKANPP